MKLTGREGKIYSEQERNDAVQNHANAHSHESHFRKSVTFGKKFLQELLNTDGAKGITFEFGVHQDGRLTLIPYPVDRNGKELPIDEEDDDLDKEPPIRTYDDPPHCPPQC